MRHRRPASSRARFLSIGLCAIGLAAGCRSIIGLSEYSVEPVTSTSTSNDPDASDPAGIRDSGSGNGSNNGSPDGSTTPDDDGGSTLNGGSSGSNGGGGGSTPMGGAGAGGASGGAGGNMPNAGAGGASDCGNPPNPSACIPPGSMGSCDGACQQDGSCLHECISAQQCGGSFDMSTIVACGPPSIGFPCVLDCKGGGPCPVANEVSCPDVAPCMVQCLEPGSCTGAFIRCKGGGCQVNCGAQGCDETTEVICGTGPCIVICEPGADVEQTEGLSCDAEKLGCGQ